MRCEGNHAPLKGVAANPWLWLLRGDDNGLKMNRFHEELGANPRRSWLNSRNGKIRVIERIGLGELTQRLGYLRMLLFPALGPTEGRLRTETNNPSSSLRQAKRHGLASPTEEGFGHQGVAPAIFQRHLGLKGAPFGPGHFR